MNEKNREAEDKVLEAALSEPPEEKYYEYKLKKTVKYNDETYEKLYFDFDKLTGEDALNIEAELSALGKSAPIPALSGEYLVRVAAKSCTKPIGADFFKLISIRDFNLIIGAARGFLLRTE